MLAVENKRVNNSLVAAEIVRAYLPEDRDREYFVAVGVNAKNQVNAIHTVSQGSLMGSLVTNREIFKFAVNCNAAGLIVAHNHPSGDASPSSEDSKVTQMIRQAGQIMGIPLLDHLIIADGTSLYFSFRDAGVL